MVTLELVRNGKVVHVVPITKRPLHIGRGPSNGLVVSDSTVSTHHAMVWAEGAQLWIRDLDSRNGTYVNSQRLTAPQVITETDIVILGHSLQLRLRGVPDESSLFARAWLIEDLKDGVRFLVGGNRFHFGSGDDAHLRLPGEDRAATLVLHADGEVWLGTDEDERELSDGEIFEVNGRSFRLVAATSMLETPTVEAIPSSYAYQLRVSLDGAVGPEATLTQADRGRRLKIEAENRAVLLYLLARKVASDREAGISDDEQGWCSDEEVSTGIWGRNPPAANSLHVLVYRLRKQIKAAGFDPWFIEKRRRSVRICLTDVTVS